MANFTENTFPEYVVCTSSNCSRAGAAAFPITKRDGKPFRITRQMFEAYGKNLDNINWRGQARCQECYDREREMGVQVRDVFGALEPTIRRWGTIERIDIPTNDASEQHIRMHREMMERMRYEAPPMINLRVPEDF